MSVENYDFDDQLVRDMVDITHFPTEISVRDSNSVTLTVVCIKDQDPWPCAIIQARRAWAAPV